MLNNPLKYTDPSGYFLKSLFKSVKKLFKNKIVRAIVAIAAAYFTAGTSLGWFGGTAFQFASAAPGALIGAGAVGGFTGGLISTGSIKAALKGAVIGGLSAGVAYGIGYGIGIDWSGIEVVKDFTHGVAQGIISEAAGGDFQSGFLGATLGHFAGRKAEVLFPRNGSTENLLGRTMVATVAGGTASALGGGKFANGAISAAFAHLFNSEVSKYKYKDLKRTEWGTVAPRQSKLIRYDNINQDQGFLELLTDVAGVFVESSSIALYSKVPVYQDMALQRAYEVNYVEVYEGAEMISTWDIFKTPTNTFREVIYIDTVRNGASLYMMLTPTPNQISQDRWKEYGWNK